jgi:hypothetical protein
MLSWKPYQVSLMMEPQALLTFLRFLTFRVLREHGSGSVGAGGRSRISISGSPAKITFGSATHLQEMALRTSSRYAPS